MLFSIDCLKMLSTLWAIFLFKADEDEIGYRGVLLSRPNKAGLKCPSVRSVHDKFLQFNEIRYVGRGWWVMHDGMQYNPI